MMAADWKAMLRLPVDRRLTSDSIQQAWKAVSFEVHPDRCHALGAEDACMPERRVMPSRAALEEALEKETKRAEEKAAKGAAAKPKASAAVRSHQKKCALRECA